MSFSVSSSTNPRRCFRNLPGKHLVGSRVQIWVLHLGGTLRDEASGFVEVRQHRVGPTIFMPSCCDLISGIPLERTAMNCKSSKNEAPVIRNLRQDVQIGPFRCHRSDLHHGCYAPRCKILHRLLDPVDPLDLYATDLAALLHYERWVVIRRRRLHPDQAPFMSAACGSRASFRRWPPS